MTKERALLWTNTIIGKTNLNVFPEIKEIGHINYFAIISTEHGSAKIEVAKLNVEKQVCAIYWHKIKPLLTERGQLNANY